MKLSWLAETLIGSEIVKLGNEINDRKRKGETIYNFTIGDFDPAIFPIPQDFENEIVNAYKSKRTNYPPADGIADLRNEVGNYYRKHLQLDYKANEILIASGGRPLLYTIYRTIVDKGDKVIYATPSWNNNHYTHFTEGEHVVLETTPETNFMPTAAMLAPHVKTATLIALCSPQNPTGTTFNYEGLQEICKLILEENKRRGNEAKKLYVIYDQMYWALTYGNTVHVNPVSIFEEMRPYTIFVDGISKVFAATGVRVGWAVAHETIIAKMKAILSHIGAWAPMAEQQATALYLQNAGSIENYLQQFKAALHSRLMAFHNSMQALQQKGYAVASIAPEGALYLTIKINMAGKKTADGILLNTQQEVTQYILDKAKLAIVPFSAFGGSSSSPWYRVSVGTCRIEDIHNVMELLEKALEALH
jgi:aspartate aminotransferase